MRILITGATGFFGSHLARAFVGRDDSVRATRRKSSSIERVAGVGESIDWQDSDADVASLTAGVDVVVHSATHYGRHGAAELEVERVNHAWPASLLAATAPSALFVNMDTSLPPALSAYARTKRRFAEHAKTATAGGGARVLNLNLESVYGPGDDPAKFQVHLVRALIRGDATYALSPGEQTRDYIFIADAVDATLRLIDHAMTSPDRHATAGVGCGRGVSIHEFAETARRIAGSHTKLEFGALAYRPGELMSAAADISRLKQLGWPGGRSIEDGLKIMIDAERGR